MGPGADKLQKSTRSPVGSTFKNPSVPGFEATFPLADAEFSSGTWVAHAAQAVSAGSELIFPALEPGNNATFGDIGGDTCACSETEELHARLTECMEPGYPVAETPECFDLAVDDEAASHPTKVSFDPAEDAKESENLEVQTWAAAATDDYCEDADGTEERLVHPVTEALIPMTQAREEAVRAPMPAYQENPTPISCISRSRLPRSPLIASQERCAHDVYLYMYDITDGLACRYSPFFFGQRIRALYHTGVVVQWRGGDLEYWFGGGSSNDSGIVTESAGRTPYGEPLDKRFMGRTSKTREETRDFLKRSSSTFSLNSYDIAYHNCNSFSAAMLEFLCGTQLPPDVAEQPGMVLSTYTGYLGYQALKFLERRLGRAEVEDRRVADVHGASRSQ